MLFYHEARDLSLGVHGDDFTFCGADEELKWITQLMQKWYEIKARATLGPEEGDDKEVVSLEEQLHGAIGACRGGLMPSTDNC